MARIRHLEKGTQDVRVQPSEVDATYQVVTAPDGTRYFHLSTFGSDKRQSMPKVSQTVQLDEAQARELVRAIQETFSGICH